LGNEYRSFSSSLCNFLHSPVTSSLLHPTSHLFYFWFLNSSVFCELKHQIHSNPEPVIGWAPKPS
jgi:hypothetical protein